MIEFLQDQNRSQDFSSPQAKWDFLKYEIRKFTRSFTQKTQSKTKAHMAELNKTLQDLGESGVEKDTYQLRGS